jgi:hypothetical protein
LREAFIKLQPDIAVVDFLTPAGTFVADELGVPCVINLPGSLQIFSILSGHLPHSENLSTCCGVMYLKQTFMQFFLRKIIMKKDFDPIVANNFESNLKRVVIINSFFGLDQSTYIPPNMVMTGPLYGKSQSL